MNTSQKLVTIAITLLLIASCKTNKFAFLDDYPQKNLPIIDSTNFSNHIEGKLLTKKEQEKLDLTAVFGEQLNDEKAKVGISYLPKISEKFTSVVYYFYNSNTELTSILVNYDEDFKIINSQMVAYDEIADSLLKTTSTINKNQIVLTEYISDSATVIKFNILENGNITRE